MKILYVTTISNTVNAFLIPQIKMLVEQGHVVDVAFNIVHQVDPRLIDLNCRIYNIEFQRSPFKFSNIKAYAKLNEILTKEKYDIIHTHTPVAATIVRLVCKKHSNIKVVYTAHGFHFYKGAPLLNWIVFFPIEKWLSKYTDVLITINQEDYLRAQSFKSKRVEYVPGVGIDTQKYNEIIVNKSEKLSELELPFGSIILLSIGELNSNKNHEIVIKALGKMNNTKIQYLICGEGLLNEHLKQLAIELGLENQVRLLGFRTDIAEICKISDIFVFPSYREGLSVALMEAMANGLPVICSDIRGNVDLIQNNQGGFLVNASDESEIAICIETIINDDKVKEQMSSINRERIMAFDIRKIQSRINDILLK